MVRTISGKIVDDANIVQLACLHDDSKPTTGIATGSLCLEVDTGDIYAFDEVSGDWNKINS